MMYRGSAGMLIILLFSMNAVAYVGTGDSAPGPLDTAPPVLQSVTALSEKSLSLTFNEAMLDTSGYGFSDVFNFRVSGTGRGTLSQIPYDVSGTGPYTMSWFIGEMLNAAPVTVTLLNLQDLMGNLIIAPGNTASGPGIGIPPEFTNVVVNPDRAGVGTKVTIKFDVSEPLLDEPEVTVNGRLAEAALGSKASDYDYVYTVSDLDPFGPAALQISGFDLAGNAGAYYDSQAFRVLDLEALPLRAWPLFAALLLAGGCMLFLYRRRRGAAALLLLLALLTASASFAQDPMDPIVTNVTFTQGPDGMLGTKVDIYFDLVAPGDPCDILVYLSKDDGADGFPFPAKTLTGDIGDLVTGTGYHIVWKAGKDYPGENLAAARVRVLADSNTIQHTLTYAAGEHGIVEGELSQVVDRGRDGTPVTAVPDEGYDFAGWSDGVLDNPRTDTSVSQDINVIANFTIKIHTLSYAAQANGSIDGETEQIVEHWTDGTPVTAVPDFGYHFVEWSDGNPNPTRQELNVLDDLSVVAIFEINTYLLEYFYTPPEGGTLLGEVVQNVVHGTDATTVSAVPNPGWRFDGWDDGFRWPDRTDRDNTMNLSVTAEFVKFWTLSYTALANGVLFIDDSTEPVVQFIQTVDEGNSGGLITAVPDYGYHFVNWSDLSADNPRKDLNVTADITVDAYFEINIYALNYAAGANGSLLGEAAQLVPHGMDGSTVEAVPDYGYHFVQWSDGSTDNPRNDQGVTGDLDVTAEFAINVYTVTYLLEFAPGMTATLYGSAVQEVEHGSNATAVYVVVNAPVCHVLDRWSDGSTANPRQDLMVTDDLTVTATFARGTPDVDNFAINGGAADTDLQDVILNSEVDIYAPECLEYMASESASFTGAQWLAYGTALNFRLATQVYDATVYFKVRNDTVESDVVSDTIYVNPMVTVPAGVYTMGREYLWDAAWGAERTEEQPAHQVELDEYQIGKHTVTTQEFCDVLNWAYKEKDFVDGLGNPRTKLFANTTDDTPYAGGNYVYVGALYYRFVLLNPFNNTHIAYSAAGSGGNPDKVFYPKTRGGYSMANFPAVGISWYGAAFYCNGLTRIRANLGLLPGFPAGGLYYNTGAIDDPIGSAGWPRNANPDPRALRLPTEAQWERAAAWDGAKHWLYGFTSDVTPTGSEWANWRRPDGQYVDPFNLTAIQPYASPPGWFNGINISPKGSVRTEYAISPVGCFDMSGNVREFCNDWYMSTWYTTGGPYQVNPTGPPRSTALPPVKAVRGGDSIDLYHVSRSARRLNQSHDVPNNRIGFRVARETDQL